MSQEIPDFSSVGSDLPQVERGLDAYTIAFKPMRRVGVVGLAVTMLTLPIVFDYSLPWMLASMGTLLGLVLVGNTVKRTVQVTPRVLRLEVEVWGRVLRSSEHPLSDIARVERSGGQGSASRLRIGLVDGTLEDYWVGSDEDHDLLAAWLSGHIAPDETEAEAIPDALRQLAARASVERESG